MPLTGLSEIASERIPHGGDAKSIGVQPNSGTGGHKTFDIAVVGSGAHVVALRY